MIVNVQPVVQIENLGKTYSGQGRSVVALADVSLTVHRGELFGLFGPNGAGKSTLVRILSTLIEPTAGRALVQGYDVGHQGLQVRREIGLVSADERSFYGRLSARENLWFYAALQNVPSSQIRRRTDEVLDLFGLLPKADATFQSLSTGQRQRLNMARALVHEPQVLFLDEPTKSMDVQTSDMVKTLVKEVIVGEQGRTVIFISHELYEMDAFCDRVAILGEGRLLAIGTPEELSQLLPRRAVYRIELTGPAEIIQTHWQELPQVHSVQLISKGMSLHTYEVTLHSEEVGHWAEILSVIAHSGGRLESYRRVDDGSLRDIIAFFGQGGTKS